MIRREKLTTELKKIAIYDKRRTVLVIQNQSTSYNVYITDKPKDEPSTPYYILLPQSTIVFSKEFGDEPELEYYAKADGDVIIGIIEFFGRGE